MADFDWNSFSPVNQDNSQDQGFDFSQFNAIDTDKFDTALVEARNIQKSSPGFIPPEETAQKKLDTLGIQDFDTVEGLKEMALNFIPDAAKLGVDVVKGLNAIASQPVVRFLTTPGSTNPKEVIDQAGDIASAVAGGARYLIPGQTSEEEILKMPKVIQDEIRKEQGFEEKVDAFFTAAKKKGLVQMNKGVVQNVGEIGTFFREKPAEALSLVAMGTQGASVLAKTGGWTKAAEKLQKVASLTDPVTLGMKGTAKVAEKLDVNKRIAPFAGAFDPKTSLTAKTEGIDLPAAALTDSQQVKRVQSIFNPKKFEDQMRKAKRVITKKFKDLTDVNFPEADLQSLGKSVKNSFTKAQKTFDETISDLYSKSLPKEVKNTIVNTTETTKKLKELVSRGGGFQKHREGASKFQSFLDDFKPVDKPAKTRVNAATGQVEVVEEASKVSPTFTYNEMKKHRTQIGKLLENTQSEIVKGFKSEIKELYGALSKDMDATLKKVDPERFKLLKETNARYAENMNNVKSTISKNIQNVDSGKMLNTLVKPKSPDGIALTKKLLEPEGFEHLQTTFISDILHKSINKRTGYLDAKKLKTSLDRYGKDVINELLTPDQIQKLDEITARGTKFDSLQKAVIRGENVVKGSQTAFLNRLLAAEWIMAGKDGLKNIIKLFVADRAASNFFNSATGKKFLTTGFKFKIPAKKLAKRIQSASKVPVSGAITTMNDNLEAS